MLAELQGRLPIKVELIGLGEEELLRILTEPKYNLSQQQRDLLKADNVLLSFDSSAISQIARLAHLINSSIENIGARRLHTVIEKVMEEVSFSCGKRLVDEHEPNDTHPSIQVVEGTSGEQCERRVTITGELVEKRLKDLLTQSDISKFIL